MSIICGENIYHSYGLKYSLEDINLTVEPGEFLAILGHNGSGKSTLAKHFNVLLPLQEGNLHICGMDASATASILNIRRKCGMVFQNPDNQFVSSVVGEDIAFGLENYKTPFEEIPQKIDDALTLVGMRGFEKRCAHMLSGGQKQRIALAGVLAVSPDILIFDESTSMLDPHGRKEVIDTVIRLHKEKQKTIIFISHYVEEAVNADKICLIHNGKILSVGTPKEILTDTDLLAKTGLTPPMAVQVYFDLLANGIKLSECPITNAELVEAICQL